MLERGEVSCVNTADLPWRPSSFAAGVFVRDIAVTDGWEMQVVVFILEGELVQAGRRLGPGWASVASAGSVDEDVRSDTGCVFVLVDRA